MSVPPLGPSLWFPFHDDELLIEEGHPASRITPIVAPPEDIQAIWPDAVPLYFGTLNGTGCFAISVERMDIGSRQHWRWMSLRALYNQISSDEYGAAGYGMQLLNWRKLGVFCPIDGTPLVDRGMDWGRECPQCGHALYPPVTPAVLALIWRKDEILLAHKPGWGARYSILAGFVEPGESLEDCVHREVKEEAGVTVCNLRYVSSQPWPYPHQIMVGFSAEYLDGEIEIDANELDHARWFTRRDLPELPSEVSLSRTMIDQWITGEIGE